MKYIYGKDNSANLLLKSNDSSWNYILLPILPECCAVAQEGIPADTLTLIIFYFYTFSHLKNRNIFKRPMLSISLDLMYSLFDGIISHLP